MTAEVLAFLGGAPGPISLFEAWEEAVLACGESAMKVSKTQISWGNPLQFAVLSQPRRAAQRRAGGGGGAPGGGGGGGRPPPPPGGPGLCWPPWGWAAGWSTPASSRPWSPIPAAGPTICS